MCENKVSLTRMQNLQHAVVRHGHATVNVQHGRRRLLCCDI